MSTNIAGIFILQSASRSHIKHVDCGGRSEALTHAEVVAITDVNPLSSTVDTGAW
jgi:hypothetical protein